MDRRAVLQAVGVGVTVGLAGCSGSGDGNGGNSGDSSSDGNSGETETATSTPTDTAELTETASPTSTQTPESQFSTQGNDSSLINKPLEELLITTADIPRDGYSKDTEQSDEGVKRDEIYRTFNGDNAGVEVRVALWNDTSLAKEFYDSPTFERSQGFEPDERKNLDIAVESRFEYGLTNGVHISTLLFRDANATGYITWNSKNSKIGLQEIGELAVTMHQRWR